MTNHLNPELMSLLRHFNLDRQYLYGQGSWLRDSEGEEILDLSSQYGALPFGHNPPAIWSALDQVKEAKIPNFVQPSRPLYAEKLAQKLAEKIPVGHENEETVVTFAQSGSEAVEIALRLCRLATKRTLIASAERGYHGHTMGAAALSWQDPKSHSSGTQSENFTRVPWNDVNALETLFREKHNQLAALVFEPVQGEGGVFEGEPHYFERASELCRKYGVKLVLDEVQTGLGRMGQLCAAELFNLRPDIIVLSKALGGGLFPLAACVVARSSWTEDFALNHGSTFANNNLGSAVGLAVLNELEKDDGALLKNARVTGELIRAHFEALKARYPGVIRDIRGRACLFAIEFEEISPDSSFFIPFLFKTDAWNGLIASYLLNEHRVRVIPSLTKARALRIQPSLNISKSELQHGLKAFEALIQTLYFKDWAALTRCLVGGETGAAAQDRRHLARPIQSSRVPLKNEKPGRFAFLMHSTCPGDLLDTNPAFQFLNNRELNDLYHWLTKYPAHAPLCTMPAIRGQAGAVAEGCLIGLSHSPESMAQRDPVALVGDIQAAVHSAEALGATVIGLGAFTSIKTGNGAKISTRSALTTGSGLTVAMAVDGLKLACERMGIRAEEKRGLILGLGVVGCAAALAASDFLPALTLTGNPKWPERERAKALQLMDKIYFRAASNVAPHGLATTLRRFIVSLDQLGPRGRQLKTRLLEIERGNEEHCAGLAGDIHWASTHLGQLPPLQFSPRLSPVIHKAELIIAASSSSKALIGPHDLRSGAIVCDVAKPADVCSSVRELRDDVLVFDGGLVRYPEPISFGPNMGYDPGINLACLTETVLLALEGHKSGQFGVGRCRDLMNHVSSIREAATRHGFSVGQLRAGRTVFQNADLERIGESARRRCRLPLPQSSSISLSA